MTHVKLLDCTLRDGGYLIDADFGETSIKGLLRGLVDANIDIIECGFLEDIPHKEGSTIFNKAADIREYIPKNRKSASFVALADYSRYTIDNLEPYDRTSIDGVRACFFKKERYDAMRFCEGIIAKGYRCYVQPVDILGYTDQELIELIELVNAFEPYTFSIVDTFGSMFQEDLQRIFHLVNHNLTKATRIGFHSHNNMQMSFALSQHFVNMTSGIREVIVDTTLMGMGRGAGNANTELMLNYLNKKFNVGYDLDTALDLIDTYIEPIYNTVNWGYSIPYFLAGVHSAHVNNINYLSEKAGISRKDMNYILNVIGAIPRKRYDYNLLERTYVDYLGTKTNQDAGFSVLRAALDKKNVLLLLPGKSLGDYAADINKYIQKHSPVVISISIIPDQFKVDFAYFSNKQRHSYWVGDKQYSNCTKILTSNIQRDSSESEIVVDFSSLVKCGWEQLDNSGVLLLRLLDKFNVQSIAIAGFDGYSKEKNENYMQRNMEKAKNNIKAEQINLEIASMLEDYKNTRASQCPIQFITPSRFERIFFDIQTQLVALSRG
jgi:4-hydroxy 2-oxovalerate aldolase